MQAPIAALSFYRCDCPGRPNASGQRAHLQVFNAARCSASTPANPIAANIPMSDLQQPCPFEVELWLGQDIPTKQRAQATAAFANTLSEQLGGAAMVLPIYDAFLRILHAQGTGSADTIDVENLSDAERHIFESWQLAEAAALAQVFGSHRHMGEGAYELKAR